MWVLETIVLLFNLPQLEVFIASNLVGSCCKVPGLDQFMKWRRPFLLAEVYAVLTAVCSEEEWPTKLKGGFSAMEAKG